MGEKLGMGELPRIVSGTVITVATIAAWLYGALHNLDTGPLFALVVPIVGALFLVGQISSARDAAQQAASQTNGTLEARVVSAVSSALAARDAARTRQANGDISQSEIPSVVPENNLNKPLTDTEIARIQVESVAR